MESWVSTKLIRISEFLAFVFQDSSRMKFLCYWMDQISLWINLQKRGKNGRHIESERCFKNEPFPIFKWLFFSLIDLQFATHFLRYKNVDLISYPLYSLKIQYLKLLRLLIWTFLKYFEFRVNYFNWNRIMEANHIFKHRQTLIRVHRDTWKWSFPWKSRTSGFNTYTFPEI